MRTGFSPAFQCNWRTEAPQCVWPSRSSVIVTKHLTRTNYSHRRWTSRTLSSGQHWEDECVCVCMAETLHNYVNANTSTYMLHFVFCCILKCKYVVLHSQRSLPQHLSTGVCYRQTDTRVHVKYVQRRLCKYASCETSSDSLPHESRSSRQTPKQINRFPGPETCRTGRGQISKAAVKYQANRVNERNRAATWLDNQVRRRKHSPMTSCGSGRQCGVRKKQINWCIIVGRGIKRATTGSQIGFNTIKLLHTHTQSQIDSLCDLFSLHSISSQSKCSLVFHFVMGYGRFGWNRAVRRDGYHAHIQRETTWNRIQGSLDAFFKSWNSFNMKLHHKNAHNHRYACDAHLHMLYTFGCQFLCHCL